MQHQNIIRIKTKRNKIIKDIKKWDDFRQRRLKIIDKYIAVRKR